MRVDGAVANTVLQSMADGKGRDSRLKKIFLLPNISDSQINK